MRILFPFPVILLLVPLVRAVRAVRVAAFAHDDSFNDQLADEDSHYDAMYESRTRSHGTYSRWRQAYFGGGEEGEGHSRRRVCTDVYIDCLSQCDDHHDGYGIGEYSLGGTRPECEDRCYRTKVTCLKRR